ncbi:hypothetical protein [Aestuariispira insulae]|uniref:Uncharacterized protein n=1 Tax=Aestuariispira insulae TaxID=1461337 RepID=A0A3D9HXT4_9PROT|nr:hypothetical protein [Aestuariispira insulae]RED54181.1 hypothetical protein DFP90_101984 [Aestuariispira insulae]
MSQINQQIISKIESEFNTYVDKQTKVDDALEQVANKVDQGLGINIDIEQATLDDVHTNQDVLNANIAELIVHLDKVTNKFGDTFSDMKAKTFSEKFVGFFSKNASDSMREKRIRTTDIQSNLNDLIDKSNRIESILVNQRDVLDTRLNRASENLKTIMQTREEREVELKNVGAEIRDLEPQLTRMDEKVAAATDPAERTALESEQQALNEKYNTLVNKEKELIAVSQSLDNYIRKFQVGVNSLQDQLSNVSVMISKIRIDTEQRSILYDDLATSLRTAQQQDIAHKLNDIGTAVDNEATVTMAAVGAASNQRMASMLEAHAGTMATNQEILERKRRADDAFMRRMSAVLEKHATNSY